MKKQVSPTTIAIVVGVVIVVIVVAGILAFKPGDAGPPIKPVPYKRPAGFSGGPGMKPGGDNPIGAPATQTGETPK